MYDPRLDRLADLLVRYSLHLRPGEGVVQVGTPLAEPLFVAFHRAALQAGAHVDTVLTLPSLVENFYRFASEEQLRFVRPLEDLIVERYDARLAVHSDPNTRALSDVEPQRQRVASAARRGLLQRVFERTAAGDLRWCVTLFPTHAYAQEADMSLASFTEFLFDACFLNDPDPIARWQALGREQERLIAWLQGKREIRILAQDTDLTLSVEGRRWINACGHFNMPDGEFFTGPVEEATNGFIRFTYPAVRDGRLVEDVWLRFENGRVVEARADRNEAYLHQMLDLDDGARRLGEFAFGNNANITRFTHDVLFDEKIAGTVHMALGASYPETGGKNQSALHWDMICDLRRGGEVYVDGQLFMKDGRFVV
ncbi:MAG TPA: aminopeptidase [Chloroflexota bacterium]